MGKREGEIKEQCKQEMPCLQVQTTTPLKTPLITRSRKYPSTITGFISKSFESDHSFLKLHESLQPHLYPPTQVCCPHCLCTCTHPPRCAALTVCVPVPTQAGVLPPLSAYLYSPMVVLGDNFWHACTMNCKSLDS